MRITNDMTVLQVYKLLKVIDKYYIEQRCALSQALGGNQEFEDWLVNGDVNDTDTIGEIQKDWEDWESDSNT